MKLDRTIRGDGKCKYALVKMRAIAAGPPQVQSLVKNALATLERAGVLDYAASGESECFVIRLRDQNAAPALAAYAMSAYQYDPEFGREILTLARKAAEHPNKHRPD
jgi:hypothetical protein